MRLVVVGLGGIGGPTALFAAKYLSHNLHDVARILLVDGDAFEPRNGDRQFFGTEGPKAIVKAAELSEMFPGISFRPITRYVTRENITGIIEEGDIVLLCVDNHHTRRVVSDSCGTLNDVTLISGGNELTDGNVQVYIRREGRDATSSLTKWHPEIQNAKEVVFTGQGCELAAREGGEQIVITNLAIAAHMLMALYSILSTGTVPYEETYIDVMSGAAQPVDRNPIP